MLIQRDQDIEKFEREFFRVLLLIIALHCAHYWSLRWMCFAFTREHYLKYAILNLTYSQDMLRAWRDVFQKLEANFMNYLIYC